jgi:hypothetical protein
VGWTVGEDDHNPVVFYLDNGRLRRKSDNWLVLLPTGKPQIGNRVIYLADHNDQGTAYIGNPWSLRSIATNNGTRQQLLFDGKGDFYSDYTFRVSENSSCTY